MEKKKILVLNGSFCETPVIKKLKEMGYYVVTSGNAPKLEGHAFSDQYLAADYSDKEQILDLVKKNQMDGIISCANDFGTITAAYVAEQMGWPGHDTYENTLLLHHKDLFKAYCAEKNIPSVQSAIFHDMEKLLKYTQKCEYPIIVKANDLTGGKGICRANNYEEVCEAAKNAFEISRDKQILVEPFVEGTQHAVDVFIADGKIIATTSCNCYSYVNPYLIQTETYPSNFESQDVLSICKIIENMVDNLHLVDGVFTVQYMRKNDQIYIIEVMRRLTGNLSFTLYEKATGFPWYEAYIRSSLGMKCNGLKPVSDKKQFCGHHGIFADRNGVLENYEIPEDIKTHVYEQVELIHPGEQITNYKMQRIASFFYVYDSKSEMEKEAQRFHQRVKVCMK